MYGHGFGIEGKPIIAHYLFVKRFVKEMALDGSIRLVAGASDDTMSIDGDVGGKLNMTIIDDSGTRKIPQLDIDKGIKRWRAE